jgi:hypothetical protein
MHVTLVLVLVQFDCSILIVPVFLYDKTDFCHIKRKINNLQPEIICLLWSQYLIVLNYYTSAVLVLMLTNMHRSIWCYCKGYVTLKGWVLEGSAWSDVAKHVKNNSFPWLHIATQTMVRIVIWSITILICQLKDWQLHMVKHVSFIFNVFLYLGILSSDSTVSFLFFYCDGTMRRYLNLVFLL